MQCTIFFGQLICFFLFFLYGHCINQLIIRMLLVSCTENPRIYRWQANSPEFCTSSEVLQLRGNDWRMEEKREMSRKLASEYREVVSFSASCVQKTVTFLMLSHAATHSLQPAELHDIQRISGPFVKEGSMFCFENSVSLQRRTRHSMAFTG